MDALPARSREPDEDEQPWLTILLDALHVLDHGLGHEVATEEQRRGARVGCHAGCTACCQSDLRLRPIEIEGIAWYASTRLDEETWHRVKAQLARPDGGVCPFLLDGQCSVRPVRPITCRTFFVFGEPCRVGERLFQLRSGDIFEHSEALYERVALRLLDDESFGLGDDEAKRAAYRAGTMRSSALRLLQVDWIATIDALRDARDPDASSPDAASE
jgi:Fe-S-cluster containining protein